MDAVEVTRVVDSYSLGRIHRIALLDNEWYHWQHMVIHGHPNP